MNKFYSLLAQCYAFIFNFQRKPFVGNWSIEIITLMLVVSWGAVIVTIPKSGVDLAPSQNEAAITVRPQSANIMGWLDQATCTQFRGWAGDTNDPNLAINVHFYDDLIENGGVFIGGVGATTLRESAVCEALKGSNCEVCPTDQPQCQHGFVFSTPSTLFDGQPHNIYAYGVNSNDNRNAQLLGTPKSIICSAAPPPTFNQTWTSIADNTSALAWGDYDNDGDLDLAVANNVSDDNRLYRNNNGVLSSEAIWESVEKNASTSLAWGDYDSDGDLDLVIGNACNQVEGDPPSQCKNRIYRNDNGHLTTSAVWEASEIDVTISVAWGDYDNDGDLDLAVGNGGIDDYLGYPIPDGGQNRIYRNNGVTEDDTPVFELIWSSPEIELTSSVAWGDYDNDGDLDLAVGNADIELDIDLTGIDIFTGEHNQLYRNSGTIDGNIPKFDLIWTSAERELTTSLAWGDYDNDGDLDLAAGNVAGEFEFGSDGLSASPRGEANLIYRNDNGTLLSKAIWTSNEEDFTWSIAWGDYDNDGYLDLAAGNGRVENGSGDPLPEKLSNRIYRNENGLLSPKAIWSSEDLDDTVGIAWGDYDSDGDLDLAAGNGNFDAGQPNRIYRNDSVSLLTEASWSSSNEAATWGATWADINQDNDLDLFFGNGGRFTPQSNELYLNNNGAPVVDNSWTANLTESTSTLAWGDYDGDGDLDVVVGNYAEDDQIEPIRLYQNIDGVLAPNPIWETYQFPSVVSLAWGDYDGDSDLDLAVGSRGQSHGVFLNEDGIFSATPNWTAPLNERYITWSVVWGDVDGDGDLDLAVGNNDKPNQIYQNNGLDGNGLPILELAWSSNESSETRNLAWGDYDGDGDLDLAVGNQGQPNQIYRNSGEGPDDSPNLELVWSSNESGETQSIAWGDYDGDGDLDLVVGNGHTTTPDGSPLRQTNQLYRNDGLSADNKPIFNLAWSSDEIDATLGVAWGDYDNDGDLDLATGNYQAPNRLYHNPRRNDSLAANDPPYVRLSRPEPTADAPFFSTSHIIKASKISIPYTLFDPEGDVVPLIFPEYSLNGGSAWLKATPSEAGGDGVTNVTASPDGTPHTFVWDAEEDLIKSDNVVFRIRAQPKMTHSPIYWPAVASQSPPFRVEAAEWFIKVVDTTNQSISDTLIYANGATVPESTPKPTLTNRAGLLNPGVLELGTNLVALAPVYEQRTLRLNHDGWAYRTYLTNLNLDNEGNPNPDTVTGPGEQRITIPPNNSLTLFNIVVSIEWDATEDYIAMIEDAFHKASDYLYDATDGQMAFEQVTIYDNAEHWSDADFQFSTKNTVRPYAFIGGITSEDKAHTIRAGRFWTRQGGNSGAWNEPDGYRTLVHEFAHYALYLEDEYFVRKTDENGNLKADENVACTDPLIKKSASGDATNASIMYWPYHTSEFAGPDDWNENCQETQQHLVNGKSDWETIAEHYGGTNWVINTPSSRGDKVMAGPDAFPKDLLPFPTATISNTGQTVGEALEFRIVDPDGDPVHNALVALYTTSDKGTIAIDQGLSDADGRIRIYGASVDDTVQAATFDGAMSGRRTVVEGETNYELKLSLTDFGRRNSTASNSNPHLNLIPASNGDALTLEVHGAAEGGTLNGLVIPGDGGGSPQFTPLAYSSSEAAYSGKANFDGVGLGTGQIQVSGGAGGQVIQINSDYNLQQIQKGQPSSLYSEDGNFEFHLPPDSIIANDAYATVLPTGYVPGPLPDGLTIIGNAYQVRLSGAMTHLEKDGVVRLHYHPEVMGTYTQTAIYYWHPNSDGTGRWIALGGTPSDTDDAWAVTTRRLGIYALMEGEFVPEVGNERMYLPMIEKN